MMKEINIIENDKQSQGREINTNEDYIQKMIGAFGRYQIYLYFVIILTKFPIAFQQMAIVFLAPKVEYTCPGLVNAICPCSNPVYDTSVFTSTIVTKWNLICDRKWLTSLTQTLFQLGVLIGSVLFGMASDRYGRRNPFLVAVVLKVTMGMAAAFMPDYWSFTFVRFLIGMSVGGTMVIGFVIFMEFVGMQYRDVMSALYQVPFNLGHILLTVFGYFFRDFQQLLLALSLPSIILLSYFFLIPETPRWLIALKRTDEAIRILERAANINNRPTENIRSQVEAYHQSSNKNEIKHSILDLFRTPNLRRNILVMSFDWLTCSYCFYGVSQYVGQLSGNVFINVAVSASVTLLGTLLSIPLMKLIGRKTIVITLNFLCGVCLLLLCVLPAGIYSIICASIGVVSSFVIFVVVYLYCSEMFPTVVRNAAIGFSSMMARVGSMMAPFVIELGDVAVWMPPLAFAIFPLIASGVTFILPETKGTELMNTLEEGEQFGRKKERNNK